MEASDFPEKRYFVGCVGQFQKSLCVAAKQNSINLYSLRNKTKEFYNIFLQCWSNHQSHLLCSNLDKEKSPAANFGLSTLKQRTCHTPNHNFILQSALLLLSPRIVWISHLNTSCSFNRGCCATKANDKSNNMTKRCIYSKLEKNCTLLTKISCFCCLLL